MAQSMILAEFDKLVRTPGDVDRLNEAILELAVRGRLVSQDAADEPAAALLARIRAEKKRLEVAGEIRTSKPLPKVKAEEMPFELPDGWVWCRMDHLASKLGAGSTPLGGKDVYANSGVKFLRSQNVWNDGLRLDGVAYITPEINGRMANTVVQSNDILLNITGASIGRSALVPDNFDVANVSQHVAIVRMVEPQIRAFLHLFLISSLTQRLIMDVQVGISRAGLSMSRLKEFVVPLPPLAEQKRIVERVDSLLARTAALKESLAAAQTERETLTAAALHRLENVADPAQAAAAWALIRENFAALIDTPENVAALKQTILQLAVQGKLVPQNPADEPASALLARIRAEKKRLEEAGELRSSKPLPQVTAEEMPFALPAGWVGVRLDNIFDIGSGTAKGRKFGNSDTISLPYLRVANVQRGYLDLNEIKEIEIKRSELAKYQLQEGDLLLTEGGDADKLGRSAIWRGEIPVCIHQNHIFRARPILSDLKAEWLMLYTNSSAGREYFLGASKQTTNLASINMTQLRHLPVPLPPLAEQQRIVARVDALFALCDGLAAGLADGEALRARWVAAVLAGV